MSFDISALFCQILLILCITASSSIFADDITVITADRIKSNDDKSSSDVRVIDSEEIKNNLSKTLPELLSKESDLSVVSSGPNGSNSSLFLRGTDSSHTLVIIDGIMMNDPSNPNRQFDIGRLSLNNIERIEILKGSQGLAYGSNAIGGVLVITTKKAVSKQLSGESFLDYGTFNTVNAGTNFQRKYDLLNISAGADYMNTSGFSAANKKDNAYAEKDGARRASLSLGINKDLSEDYIMDLNLRYSHNVADVDKGGGPGNDDPNDRQKEEEIYSKMQLTKNWSGNAQTQFSYNRAKHHRLFEVQYDSAHPQNSNSLSVGEMNSLTANHTYYISDLLTQNLNVEFTHEKDQSGHYNRNFSGFLYHQYELPSSIFNFGIRLDHNISFNDHITYKGAAGYKINASLLKLSYSTGFRAPSLNQLYDPTFGNKDLLPETSNGLDISLENRWSDQVKTTSTLFYTKIKNRLSFHPNTFININMGTAEISGFEESTIINWTNLLDQTLSITLLKTRDLRQGKRLARRPDINLKNIFNLQVRDKHHLGYEFSLVGQRSDVDNLGNTVQMKSFLLSNLNYRYVLNNQYEYYFKIKNVFDTKYEEIFGFGTSGRAFTMGMQYTF
ncbi:MAG: TonB-dependent receptor plug domain-containing protein [Bacteriovorax sp.]|jgi:vitamin B12 transporter